MSGRRESDEAHVADALTRLFERVPGISDDDLREVAAAASEQPRSAGAGRSRRPRLRTSTAVALAGVALLAGSGLGFGLASSLTPSGSASGIVGFGFLPSPGWNVVQSGTLDASGVARAVAANVPLDPRDDLRRKPLATIRQLPPRGVLISATFRLRGDPAIDATFPVRQPPLHLDDAEAITDQQLELRAAIRGYNVELTVVFGVNEPSAQLLLEAERQLRRLLVEAERVTIFARPAVSDRSGVTLYGSIESGKAGETVAIQARDCGSQFFRVADGAVTEPGGSWSTNYYPGVNTTVRAVWNEVASAQLTIRQRARVTLARHPSAARFRVSVGGKRSFWRKNVHIQRFDRRLGRWTPFKSVVLTETVASGGPFASSASFAEFTIALPKGTPIRAVFPLAQARPCYLAGTSRPIRT